MKKKLMILSLAIVSAIGFSAFAQNPEVCNNPACPDILCGQPGQPGQPGGPQGPQGKIGKKGPRPDRVKVNAFEGITLTTDQQAKLDQLNADRKAKRDQARVEKAKADSVKQVARRQAKLDYLKQVQAILTPDQYITYLENLVVSQPGKGKAPMFNGQGPAPQGPNGPKFDKPGKGDKAKCDKKDGKDKKDKKDKKNK